MSHLPEIEWLEIKQKVLDYYLRNFKLSEVVALTHLDQRLVCTIYNRFEKMTDKELRVESEKIEKKLKLISSY